MAISGFSRTAAEEDNEDEDDEGFDEDFIKQMTALKQACQMHAESRPGGEVKLKSSTLATRFEEEEEEDDEEDDDALLLSIERKFMRKDVSASSAPAPDQPEEEEDDDALLLSIERNFLKKDDLASGPASVLDQPEDAATCETFVPSTPPYEDHVEDPDAKGFAGSEVRSFLPAQLNEDDECNPPDSAGNATSSPVPENVQAVAHALSKNRVCQQTLRDVLRQVEMKLQVNKDMQRRAQTLIEFQRACKRKFSGFTEVANSSLELIASKHSRKKTGEFKVKGPPNNPDVETFRKLQCQLPAEFNVRKWLKKESQALVKGVRQQLQEIRLRAVMKGWASDEEGQDFNEQLKSIGEQDLTQEDLQKILPLVDWNEVARIYVKGRTPSECRLQWENNESPLVNLGPWTKVEDKKLLILAQAHDMVEWAAIAEKLGTRRTPAQCATRFQRSLNATILRSAWTPEEDEQLQAAVEKFGEKDWQAVAACLEGRLGSQCMSRWTKVLHPDRHRRGRWEPEEDTRLKWAVSVYGPRGWKNIAAHVPGRSDVQCRERWCNVLDPSVKIDDWTPEENTKLEELVVKYGRHRWAAVASELGRTDNQCFRHWKLLHPKHKMSFKKDMAIRRAAFSSNFVGREKERPDLGLQDFLPPADAGVNVNSDEPPKNASTKKSGSHGTALKKARPAKRGKDTKGTDSAAGKERANQKTKPVKKSQQKLAQSSRPQSKNGRDQSDALPCAWQVLEPDSLQVEQVGEEDKDDRCEEEVVLEEKDDPLHVHHRVRVGMSTTEAAAGNEATKQRTKPVSTSRRKPAQSSRQQTKNGRDQSDAFPCAMQVLEPSSVQVDRVGNGAAGQEDELLYVYRRVRVSTSTTEAAAGNEAAIQKTKPVSRSRQIPAQSSRRQTKSGRDQSDAFPCALQVLEPSSVQVDRVGDGVARKEDELLHVYRRVRVSTSTTEAAAGSEASIQKTKSVMKSRQKPAQSSRPQMKNGRDQSDVLPRALQVLEPSSVQVDAEGEEDDGPLHKYQKVRISTSTAEAAAASEAANQKTKSVKSRRKPAQLLQPQIKDGRDKSDALLCALQVLEPNSMQVDRVGEGDKDERCEEEVLLEEEDDPLHVHHKVRVLMGPKNCIVQKLRKAHTEKDEVPGDSDTLGAFLLLHNRKRLRGT